METWENANSVVLEWKYQWNLFERKLSCTRMELSVEPFWKHVVPQKWHRCSVCSYSFSDRWELEVSLLRPQAWQQQRWVVESGLGSSWWAWAWRTHSWEWQWRGNFLSSIYVMYFVSYIHIWACRLQYIIHLNGWKKWHHHQPCKAAMVPALVHILQNFVHQLLGTLQWGERCNLNDWHLVDTVRSKT